VPSWTGSFQLSIWLILHPVYQLSAQFPGPVAPREFITCLLTTETGLSESSAQPVEGSKSAKAIPRHYMVVSIPIDHPDAPLRNGLVRGSYESVEIIREIPLTQPKAMSTPNLLNLESEAQSGRNRGSTIGFAESRGLSAKGENMDRHSAKSVELEHHASLSEDPESNPVEWIMITRSDPGGGIPRFMVERGTPASITADAAKFVDWATSKEEAPSDDEDLQAEEDAPVSPHIHHRSTQYSVAAGSGHLAGVVPPSADVSNTGAYEPSTPGETGIIASLTNYAQAGFENYAPNVVQNNAPAFMRRDLSSDSDSDTESFNSFTSATADFKTAREGSRSPDPLAYSTSNLDLLPDSSSGAPSGTSGPIAREDTQYEKEITKLEEKRRTLDDKMIQSREKDAQRTSELSQKEEKDAEKQREKIERDKRKQEERYAKEMRKIEERREKEARRLEDRKRKARDKDILSKTSRERDEYRRQLELVRRENELLRRQMGELQKENTLFVAKFGKSEMGASALKQVRDELQGERKRASSVGSRASGRSKLSAESVKGGDGVVASGRATPTPS
jgi:hypothetical protein